MKKVLLTLLPVLLAIALVAGTADKSEAVTFYQWDYNANTTPTTQSLQSVTNGGFVYGAGSSDLNTPNNAFKISDVNGVSDGLRWNLSTVGYTGISVELDFKRFDSNVAKEWSWQYYDGSTWRTISSVTYSDNNFHNNLTLDLTSNIFANNNPNLQVQFVATGGFTFNKGGNIMGGATVFDMLQVNGSPVPVPAAAWLLGTGLIGLIAIRRRKAK